MIKNFVKNFMILLFIVIVITAFTVNFYFPEFFNEYDKEIFFFLISMYMAFYIVNYFLEKRLNSEKLVGKDLVFLSLKFLIQIFYAAIRSFTIKDMKLKKDFLLHFLIYAMLFLIFDTIVYYQTIKKNG